ncbi:MAG TPA: MlaD family protein [Polyangiales bacterium]|nr:MlaD family protein [Polyangiales bacterium]
MSTPTNHWKLGLFVVAAGLVALGAMAYFGSRRLPREVVTYTSYFDEAVTGLEVGSAVKFRGVSVGNVSNIAVAPDRRHVQVSYDLAGEAARRLALDQAATEKSRIGLVLRAQLGSMGVTGNKYVSLDLFDSAEPADPLSFPPAQHYIPTQASTLKNLEAAVTDAAHRLPEVTGQLAELLGRINHIMGTVQEQQIPQRAGQSLERLDHTLALIETRIEQLNTAGISQDVRQTFASLQESIGRFDRLLARVDGQGGVLANAERASLNVGDAVRNASHVGSEAERTLREVGEAAASVRELVDAIERQPDMLVKGRARAER